MRKISSGSPAPLGATLHSNGVNFAVFSQHATKVELVLFEHSGLETRIPLPERTNDVWHGFVEGIRGGQHYGYRVHGPYRPNEGHRFNPSKFLLDPYARAHTSRAEPSNSALGHFPPSAPEPNPQDSSDSVPRSVVVGAAYDWAGDTLPKIPLEKTVIYETHVKGFTLRHLGVPPQIRGTFAGMCHPVAIEHLLSLGVTSVELLPVQAHVNDNRLRDIGLSNYWGYNTIGFFAPEPSYSSDPSPEGQIREFKNMVRSLHAAGLEVILDVVYNHTGEGNHLGPTLSFRGFDNAAYYRLNPADLSHYEDVTGTGNTLDVRHPRVLQLICDSLRYWATEMHVDGFRFDLATALGRDENGFAQGAAFFDIILQDPVLSGLKLIAEPWDLGAFGYQVGGFPHPWCEWNGKYRDNIRSFWRGDPDLVDNLASRVAGSSDIYSASRRGPTASVNFITSHDGFTLTDLVSYNTKHNLSNGEENRDGDSNNHSWNCGVEGPTSNPKILALRRKQRRNFIATLMLSQGVPMLLEGDEFGRTKAGNNNTYCQDNELNWLNWSPLEEEKSFKLFVSRMVRFRLSHPVFLRRRFFSGRPPGSNSAADIVWFSHTGVEMTVGDWHDPKRRSIGMLLNGDFAPEPDDSFLILFYSGDTDTEFILPGGEGVLWQKMLDTANEESFIEDEPPIPCGFPSRIYSRSLQVFRLLCGSSNAAQMSVCPQPSMIEDVPTTNLNLNKSVAPTL